MALTKSMIRGLMPALTTPVDGKGGVDRAAVRTQVEVVLQAGAAGLVPVGGTGEYAALAPPAAHR